MQSCSHTDIPACACDSVSVNSLTTGKVCQRIPRQTLEVVYGLSLPQPREGEDPHRPPHAQELLNAYGCGCGLVLWAWLSLDTLLFLHTSPSPPHIPSSLPPSLLPDLHGYMTSHGMPDCPRSARYILKDYVKVSDNRRAVTVIETETESINWECLSTGKTVVLPPSSWIRPETVQQPPADGGREGGEEGRGEKGRR